MTAIADCKRSIEIEIPLEQVEKAREQVTQSFREKARLPGFRPGKAPATLVGSRFASEIRQEVLEQLLPQAFRERVGRDELKVVGTPDITDLQFEPGQPIRFKAEFEVAPEFELGEYRGLEVTYQEPTVSDEEVDQRLEVMREAKADYVNVDPRPIQDGDFVLARLESVAGVAEPIEQDNLQIEVGASDTVAAFSENLRGMQPGETREFDVTYPADYGEEKLAGRSVRFAMTAKVIRRKELPALDDEFARDLGDYQTIGELREAVRRTIFQEKQFSAQHVAKEALIDRLVEAHQFAVPEVFITRQIETQVGNQMSELAGRGIDPKSLKLDWAKIQETQREKALRNVRAALLLDRIAEREAVHATQDEVDREIKAMAKREREPVPTVRARLEKEGALPRLADQIRTEKTIRLLFEQARKRA